MSYINTSDNTKLYYEIKGEGKPILFIHGFSEDHNSFRIQQRALSKKYKIITYDLRGHGISDRVNYGLNIERFALDLKELIEALDLKDVILVGWSMGASIIFEYINQFALKDIDKICIVDMGPKSINTEDWKFGLIHGKYKIDDFKEDLDLIKDDWLKFAQKFIKKMSPDFDEKQFNIAVDKIKQNSPHVMHAMWKSTMEKDYRNILKKIDIPTLILFGENSTFYSTKTGEYLRENISKSKLIVFEKCTHLLVLENPIKFNKALEEFI